jgi:hypothetical protein
LYWGVAYLASPQQGFNLRSSANYPGFDILQDSAVSELVKKWIPLVAPAQAEAQGRKSTMGQSDYAEEIYWIPAFAGMTEPRRGGHAKLTNSQAN